MRTQFSLLLAVTAIAVTTLHAQTPPAPVVVQAAAPAAQPAAAGASSASAQATLQLLNSMRATNAEVLKKQEATLLQLEELQKAAEQIKIYSKRG